MKIKILVLFGVLSNLTINSQCLTINCPASITTTNVLSSCSATVNYSTPIVINSCGAVVSTTFAFTGTSQPFIVPIGVTSLTIEAWGAQGGANWVSNVNYGGYTKGTIVVVPSQTLQVFVGSKATSLVGGFNGGGSGEGLGIGGGGASDVRVSPYGLVDRILVAGGAGGAGYWSSLHIVGGVGGGLVGGLGYRDTPLNEGGQGGTQIQTGLGTCSSFSNPAVAGGFGFGGNVSGCGCEGYGGGGGYYGGGGSGNCRGGGGGSGYLLPTATNTVFTSGINIGNGKVIISYSGASSSYTTSLISGLVSGSSFPAGTTIQTYTVIDNLSNTNTCSFSVTVNVGSIPTVSVTSGAICSGQSFTMVASGASTYNYTGGSAVVTPTANMSYSVTGTSSVGCVSSNTAVSTVTVNANPTISASASSAVICAGEATILSATASSTTYTWNTGATTSSLSVSPTTTTNYTVNTSDVNGCTGTANVNVTVNACTGINEVTASLISVYPNPNNGVVNITLTAALAQNSTIEIYDALGKLVVKQVLTKELNAVNMSNLDNGIYVFKVLNNNNTVKIGKLIKQ